MTKLLLVLGAFFLVGCAAGINHNVVQFDGKTYLIETHNRNALGLIQWTEKTKYTELRNQDIGRSLAKQYIKKIINECNAVYNSNPQKAANCIVDSIQKY